LESFLKTSIDKFQVFPFFQDVILLVNKTLNGFCLLKVQIHKQHYPLWI